MKSASKIILSIEAIFLAYLTVLALIVSIGKIVPYFIRNTEAGEFLSFLIGSLLFLSLFAGWRIFCWVLFNGPKQNKKVHIFWWLIALVGLILVITACLLTLFNKSSLTSFPEIEIFKYGVFFLLTIPHLFYETIIQRRR